MRDKLGKFTSKITEADKAKIKKWIAVMPKHIVVAKIIERWGVHQTTADRWIRDLTN